MQLNANKSDEVIFSCKQLKPCLPPALLDNDKIERKSQHKHLGMQLDSELNVFKVISKKLLEKQEGV